MQIHTQHRLTSYVTLSLLGCGVISLSSGIGWSPPLSDLLINRSDYYLVVITL